VPLRLNVDNPPPFSMTDDHETAIYDIAIGT
jgi:hypothetical protein